MNALPRPRTAAGSRDELDAVVRSAGTSFYWAMRLLPPVRREAMFSVYAFCRLVDDVADEPASPEERNAALAAWREEVEAVFSDSPRSIVGEGLLRARKHFGITEEHLSAVIDGMEMDANGPIRAPDRQTFDLYCDRVAVAVGRLSLPIFGAEGDRIDALARHQGRALQITNILRDLRDDAEIGRLYMPRDILEKHGIQETDPHKVLAHENFDAAARELAAVAEDEFQKARALMGPAKSKSMRPAKIMLEVYAASLRRLQRRGWHNPPSHENRPFLQKIREKLRKLWIAVRYGVF